MIRDTSRQAQTVPEEHSSLKDHLRQIVRPLNSLIKWQARHPIDVPVTATATYTMVDSDHLIPCNATGAAFTVFLLTAAGREGRRVVVKKDDATANVVTVNAKDAETIDGALTKALSTQYQSVELVSNGTNWEEICCGAGGGGASAAEDVTYDNGTSGLTATDVQAAIDEIVAEGGGGSTAGTAAGLASAILALTPTAYWKCDDASTSLQDSSGNGYHLTTLSGTTTFNHAPLLGADSTSYIRFGTVTSVARETTALGVTAPLSGDWTVSGIIMPEVLGGDEIHVVVFSGDPASETEANNIQIKFAVTSAGTPFMFWENGAGTNVVSTCTVAGCVRAGSPVMLSAVKDGTANTVTFYRNGMQMGAAVAYTTNETTGGSGTLRVNLHYDTVTNSALKVSGHIAFFNGSKVSAANIYGLAKAAGLTGS